MNGMLQIAMFTDVLGLCSHNSTLQTFISFRHNVLTFPISIKLPRLGESLSNRKIYCSYISEWILQVQTLPKRIISYDNAEINRLP